MRKSQSSWAQILLVCVGLNFPSIGRSECTNPKMVFCREFKCAQVIGKHLEYPEGQEMTFEGKPRYDDALGLIILPVPQKLFEYYFITDTDIYHGAFRTAEDKELEYFQFKIAGYGNFTAISRKGQGTQIFKDDENENLNFCDKENSAIDFSSEVGSPGIVSCKQAKIVNKQNELTTKMLQSFLANYLQESKSVLTSSAPAPSQSQAMTIREGKNREAILREINGACNDLPNADQSTIRRDSLKLRPRGPAPQRTGI